MDYRCWFIIFLTGVISITSGSSSSTVPPPSGSSSLLNGMESGSYLPGCHRVGHTRRVTIPDCVSFQITTNACRGQCESWSVPSAWESLVKNPEKVITSTGQCCNIMASEDVSVRVMCVGGPRDFTFKSAKTCSCYNCKRATE